MLRREFLKKAAISTTAAGILPGSLIKSISGSTHRRLDEQPNIIFIMIDDLGKEWLTTCGAEHDDMGLPNIEALASGGMRFTNAYSMPQCTPARITLLTGQYPWRTGWVHHWDVPGTTKFPEGELKIRFDPEVHPSFATILQSAGYKTAVAGKWQINDFRLEPEVMLEHGFDDYCLWTGKESGNEVAIERYWNPYIHTTEGSMTYEGQFGPDIYTDFLINFMEENVDHPMMLYFPMCLIHNPVTATPLEPDLVEEIDGKLPMVKAMIRYTDHLLGRLTDSLDALGIRDNTIIIWTTDNGTAKRYTGNIDGDDVQGGKTKISEAGVNAPFIVNCSGLVPAGVVTDTLTDFTDMLPTFADLGEATIPDGLVLDGHSIADVILGNTEDGTRDWILGVGSGGGTVNILRDPPMEGVPDYQAVNEFDHKQRAIRNKQYKLWIENSEDGVASATQFYDLFADPRETVNLIDSTDETIVAALNELLTVWASFPAVDAIPTYGPIPEVNVVDESQKPENFKLYQNFPNPFNPDTEIRFELGKSADVKLEVYDVKGRLISTLVDKRLSAGHHNAQFKGSGLPSGIYTYTLTSGASSMSKQCILIK
ncbi:MAG: sulfatase-like hydrolase/transferase [Candidatus Marinimicrobia bacterium]|jgi:arylsulfatase A-like enzyme|nr:sulfatase-like hydrolase/transferase [Candidatus Neomarinimicrobiota bacterium]MBT3823580.1 sulfatase-like hydrolase/transferase [Candidatus Neomarinimicrobiota bacterium]MBT4129561.1 sulfatase-like hydrolase/transferase [Candidatus Neomarinimicrobiota bacterium]MBT4295913.1 sulfatase-like hydrolase/transferase [Candidatus Neomarinimicrobiota bacterium]MBT4420085.1 sulfatase-like hydrolase/transferase [Candidatus Neomarinimicrobiota bacterium]